MFYKKVWKVHFSNSHCSIFDCCCGLFAEKFLLCSECPPLGLKSAFNCGLGLIRAEWRVLWVWWDTGECSVWSGMVSGSHHIARLSIRETPIPMSGCLAHHIMHKLCQMLNSKAYSETLCYVWFTYLFVEKETILEDCFRNKAPRSGH